MRLFTRSNRYSGRSLICEYQDDVLIREQWLDNGDFNNIGTEIFTLEEDLREYTMEELI
jgi:hypothetical protein